MRIVRLEIENYKAISHLEMDCSSGFNVFIGDNGVGKSSVLSAVKLLYSWFAAKIINRNGKGSPIPYEDIRHNAPYCTLFIKVEHQGETASWRLSRSQRGYKGGDMLESNMTQLSIFLKKYSKNSLLPNEASWPVMTFYGVNRGLNQIRLEKSTAKEFDSHLDLYTSLRVGSEWKTLFTWYYSKFNEESRMRAHISQDYRDEKLAAVNNCLVETFTGYGRLQIEPKSAKVVIEKEGELFDFKQLSDGEKCYIALVMDITRRLSEACVADVKEAENVFLIDEVDLHLHPQWQLTVIDKLRRSFPKCQFFLTTHSSLILSGLEKEDGSQLVALKNGRKREISSSPYGDSGDYILTRFFDLRRTRNERVQNIIDEIASELSKAKPDLGKIEFDLNWLDEHDVQYPDACKYRLTLAQLKKKI